jgi:hypothetical protein
MHTRLIATLTGLTLLSACATQQSADPVRARKPNYPSAGAAPPLKSTGTGVDRVIGKDARTLVSLFGAAIQDVREQGARKLQFGGTGCILDAYLYPPAKGREPLVTYVDARLPDGRDTDRAACIMTLSRGR